jgi:hypothetical protein
MICVETDPLDSLPYALRSIQAGKHTKIDKPPGADLNALQRIFAEAERRRLLFARPPRQLQFLLEALDFLLQSVALGLQPIVLTLQLIAVPLQLIGLPLQPAVLLFQISKALRGRRFHPAQHSKAEWICPAVFVRGPR